MPEEPEWQTRQRLVDPRLETAGWQVVRFDPSRPLSSVTRHAIKEYPTENGPADYALCRDGRVFGVVEAKKLSLGPQGVLTQAERYSRGATANPFNFDGFHVPFLYSTNGKVIWFHDVRHALNRSRRIAGFHSPSALEEMIGRDFSAACGLLLNTPNDHPKLRPYQIEANTEIERAIADRKRQMLVAMATGTGKTFTMVNQVHRLMKSGLAKRILFLVDRRALAAQAVREFASFEAEPGRKFKDIYEVYSQAFHRGDFEDEKFDPTVLPHSYLTDPQPGHAFVYVCTIQRMAINLFGRTAILERPDEPEEEEEVERINIPIHAFDVVIPDECHRGYTAAELSVWRNTLDHFDAIKIGLTATPAAHTTAYFKEQVYRYEYDRAVREGYLVDYDLVALRSDVRIKGIFLREGETVGIVDTATGAEQMDLLEDEREFDASEVERKATAPDSNRKILEEVNRYALEHQERYGRFPKTLIFAVNDLPHTSHADQLVDTARDIFGRGDAFVQKITAKVDRPLQRIREFRNRPDPGVVVTVDLLTTGIDIRDLEFLVFLRFVKSRILFEQMLGRGTRRGDWFAPDKSHFTVFDCFNGTLFEYFRQATAMTAEPPERASRTIGQVIEDIWQNRDRDYNVRCLVKRLQRIDKEMSGDAREMFAAFISGGSLASFAAQLPRLIRDDFTATMSLLRDGSFQDLLSNYPRPESTFVVAYGTQDTVSSEWLIRGGAGREYRPEDYLAAFARFVRDNPAQIQAIEILLNRPRDWSTDALGELRLKLASTPEQFTIQKLQKVHEAQYHKALVDIISMVKHGARETEPLYTAEERVKLAFLKVTVGRTFTAEQQQWLEHIRDHLIENLSIDQQDFDDLPVFARGGGWRRADRAFNGQLSELVKELNEAIAA
jgi:type I restriction enzyme R subunit